MLISGIQILYTTDKSKRIIYELGHRYKCFTNTKTSLERDMIDEKVDSSIQRAKNSASRLD